MPLGEGLWAVQSREWTAAGGGNPGVGLWQLQGTWDQSLSGYQQLDYRAQDWRLLTSAGHSIAIADLSMIASPDGYRLQARDVEISGGSPAEAEGEDIGQNINTKHPNVMLGCWWCWWCWWCWC